MTKTDLINFIAEETGLTKADSARMKMTLKMKNLFLQHKFKIYRLKMMD